MAACLCYLTRVTSHPFEWGCSQWGGLCLCRVGQHTPPDFHGCRARRENRDEILKCATYAFKQVFVWMFYIVSVLNHCVEEFISRRSVFIIISVTSFQTLLMRSAGSLKVPGNTGEGIIQYRKQNHCNAIYCNIMQPNITWPRVM